MKEKDLIKLIVSSVKLLKKDHSLHELFFMAMKNI